MPSGSPSCEPLRTHATAPVDLERPDAGHLEAQAHVLADRRAAADVSRKMPPFDKLIE